MKKQFRVLGKLALTAILVVLFIWLIAKDKMVWQLKQPEGKLVKIADVRILTMELIEADAKVADESGLRIFWEEWQSESENLNYGTYKQLLGYLIGDQEPYLYERKYRDEFFMLEKDFEDSYGKLLRFFGLEDVIRQEQVDILCDSSHLVGEEKLEDQELLGKDGTVYSYVSSEFKGKSFTTLQVYMRENRLLTVKGELSLAQSFSNVWIMECNREEMRFFDGTYEISLSLSEVSENILVNIELDGFNGKYREQIADLTFEGGMLEKLQVKSEKVSGKLLSIGERNLEIEGTGILEMADGCVGYQLFDKLRRATLQELSLGYSFSDYVLEDGKVCAFLITQKEKMENIRVAIKDNGSGSIYHSELEFSCSDVMEVVYGEYDDRKSVEIPIGETFRITKDSDYLKGGRIEITSAIQTGKITVLSQKRADGVPSYRGNMEITDTDQGLVLINELPLEEYLYSVVPSEMPASYPIEALKAQAVCARTYGYRYLEWPGYGNIGAHLDDSVSYQVYNNIVENVNSTRAVKETSGIILSYQGEPVNAYYYSTSCGFGGDAGVWNEDQKNEMPYLRSVYIGSAGEGDEGGMWEPEELSVEEDFRQYILNRDDKAYEKDEAWFRWNYEVEELDVSLLSERLKERYRAASGKVLCENRNGEFVSEEPDKFKEIYDIRCVKRKVGGVMDELLIDTDKGTYKVISEYNIRYILNQKGDVVRQDGSVSQSSTLLPSAYMIIDVVKSGDNVIGYTLTGGGYGHGVGMSQNGARAMGLRDMRWEEILRFYFDGCQTENVYE